MLSLTSHLDQRAYEQSVCRAISGSRLLRRLQRTFAPLRTDRRLKQPTAVNSRALPITRGRFVKSFADSLFFSHSNRNLSLFIFRSLPLFALLLIFSLLKHRRL
jgi:hypothetical protein